MYIIKAFFPVALPLGILFLVTLVLWLITFIRQNQKYAKIKANGLPLQIFTYYCHEKYKASGSDSDDYYIWLSTSPDYPAKKIECEKSTFYSFEAGGSFYYIYRSENGETPAVYSCEQYELDSVLQKYIK